MTIVQYCIMLFTGGEKTFIFQDFGSGSYHGIIY